MHVLCKPVKLYLFLLIAGLAAILTSCIVPKKYQPQKPFVYCNKYKHTGKSSRLLQKADLKLKLENQLDDSLKTTAKNSISGR